MSRKVDLIIDEATDYTATQNVVDSAGDPLDISAFELEAQLRKHYTSNSYTTINATAGGDNTSVVLTFTPSTTANLDGRYFYDCYGTSDDNAVSKLLHGVITVMPRATK